MSFYCIETNCSAMWSNVNLVLPLFFYKYKHYCTFKKIHLLCIFADNTACSPLYTNAWAGHEDNRTILTNKATEITVLHNVFACRKVWLLIKMLLVHRRQHRETGNLCNP